MLQEKCTMEHKEFTEMYSFWLYDVTKHLVYMSKHHKYGSFDPLKESEIFYIYILKPWIH